MIRPRLVLHPGFAKCATSTIQRAFVLRGLDDAEGADSAEEREEREDGDAVE